MCSASSRLLLLFFMASLVTGARSQVETAPATTAAFQHPGIFSSRADLDTIRRRIAANRPGDAMVTGMQSLLATKYANVDYIPNPVAIVTRADHSDSPVNERDAAMTAYTLALRWAISGDEKSRAKSLEIMDAWANTFEKHTGDVNTYLDSAWVVTVWSAAGELMRYAAIDGKTSGWDSAHIAKFAVMVRYLEGQSSTIIRQPFNPVSNWGTSAMLGDIAAGIFLDDRTMYDRGKGALLKYLPRIISKIGCANEITRDAWHGTVAFTGAIEAAEACRHQNDQSIYQARYDGQTDPRLVVAMRWYADPLRGIPSGPLPEMNVAHIDKPAGWTFNAPNTARTTGGFEMALNYYTYLSPTPGLEGFRDMVMKDYRPSGQDHSLFILSDSLTHGDLSKPLP